MGADPPHSSILINGKTFVEGIKFKLEVAVIGIRKEYSFQLRL
jgi:hypothetical protein